MREEQSYPIAHVNEPKKVIEFLQEHLEFFDHRQIIETHIDDQNVILSNKLGNTYLFQPSLTTYATADNFNEIIIIKTANCLRDYHQLRIAGIRIEQVPKYTVKGLEVIVSDNYGNRCMLLEERDYSEI